MGADVPRSPSEVSVDRELHSSLVANISHNVPTVLEFGELINKDTTAEPAEKIVHWDEQFGEESGNQPQMLSLLRHRMQCEELRTRLRLEEALQEARAAISLARKSLVDLTREDLHALGFDEQTAVDQLQKEMEDLKI